MTTTDLAKVIDKMLLANPQWEPFPQLVRTPPHGGKGTAQRLALMTSRIGTGDIQRAQSPKNDPKKRSVALSETSPATSLLVIVTLHRAHASAANPASRGQTWYRATIPAR